MSWCCSYKCLGPCWSDTVINFPWCLKLLSIIINSNVCNLILMIFLFFCRFSFNGVSRFLMYIINGIRRHSNSVWWVKCHINAVISCVVTLWNWDRDCNNISSRVRLISVLFSKFANLANSVDHNGTIFFFVKCLNYDIFIIVMKNYLIKWKIWYKSNFYGNPIP